MNENEDNNKIKDENKNYLNIMTENNVNNNEKQNSKDFPQFSDILSISSNPEEIFTLLYPIGHGGFGTVYKAIHNETKIIYAIKIINFISSLKNNLENFIFNNNYSSAQQESSLMKLCHKSNYIVNYYGSYYSKKSNTLWLILEYCPAGSLIDLMLSMNRTYTEQEISTIMKNVLNGLILIHSKNLIHRDIKAANIFLSKNGFAKLGDFGVGTKLGINDWSRKSKKGSPYWMSPQVVKNLDYDMKTDIWSLGITCGEMCNGEPPFAELNPKNVMEKIGKQPPKVDEIIKKEEHSYEFYDFVQKCLQVEPKKRPNAKELIKHEFIVKYAKDNNFIKDLMDKHKDDIVKFRKYSNEINGNKYIKIKVENKEIKNDLDDSNIIKEKAHHVKNNESNITSHFNDDIKENNFKEKENLLIKMISSSSNVDNIGITSTKDSQKEKIDLSSKTNYKNFPTFHKIEDENNINDDSDSLEIKEIHNLCKSFDTNYFTNNKKLYNKLKNEKNTIKIKLIKTKEISRNKTRNNKEKLNLLLDINEKNLNTNKIIYNKKKKNIGPKSRNIINKSSDNILNKSNKYNNLTNTNFVYVKTRIKKRENNKKIFKKPIVHYKNKNCKFYKTINNDNLLLDTEGDEGHINNTNFFNTKSNFNLLKNINIDNTFSKTNYSFYKGLLKIDEINIDNSNINNDNNNDE